VLAWSVHTDRLKFGRQRPTQPVVRARVRRFVHQTARQLEAGLGASGHVL